MVADVMKWGFSWHWEKMWVGDIAFFYSAIYYHTQMDYIICLSDYKKGLHLIQTCFIKAKFSIFGLNFETETFIVWSHN